MEFGWKWLLPVAILIAILRRKSGTGRIGLGWTDPDQRVSDLFAFDVFAAIAVASSPPVVGEQQADAQRQPAYRVLRRAVRAGDVPLEHAPCSPR